MNLVSRVLVLAAVLSVQGCCSTSSDAGAARARQLTQTELGTLYEQMEGYSEKQVRWGAGGEPLPQEFADAGAKNGDVGHLDRLVFGGCMDDKAVLHFEGLRGTEPRQIVLIPGERLPIEVLWRDASLETL